MNQERRDGERYREAAKLAIEQLEWVIRLLHRIRKPEIADRLEQNRRTIVKRYGL